jgi:hypothetical protein
MVRRPNYFVDARRVENEFARIVGAIIELTEVLNNVSGVRMIDSSWLKIPEELKNSPEMRAAIEERRYWGGSSPGPRATWIQHGDLSVENISLDMQTGRIEVVDWADLAGGFPPLYDLFSLFYSTGYLVPADEAVRFCSEEARWIASFDAVFFSDTGFAQIARELMLHACQRMKVQPELIPALLVEFLLVRLHYYRTRSLVEHRIHLRLLQQFCLEQNRSVFGWFPAGRPSASLSSE